METRVVTSDQVTVMLREGQEVAFVDVRDAEAYAASAMILPCATRVEPDVLDASLALIPHGRPLVLYAGKGQDEVSTKIGERLLSHGWDDVSALEGGFDAWKDAGHPVEEKVLEA